MSTNPSDVPVDDCFLAELRTAVDRFDHRRVETLCAELIGRLWAAPAPCPSARAAEVLAVLRRKRHFERMRAVAEVLIQTGQTARGIRRLHAQALLDGSQVSAALGLLQVLLDDCRAAGDATEAVEVAGLIGRAHKQACADRVRGRGALPREHLTAAIAAYAEPYREDPARLWHGVNAVALLTRGNRAGLALGDPVLEAGPAARDILERIREHHAGDMWQQANAAEMCLALGREDEALEWTCAYAAQVEADAFELAGTLRQFEDLWELRDDLEAHARILNTLRAALLEREGGAVSIEDPAACIAAAGRLDREAPFEALLGTDRYQSFRQLLKGLRQARLVARIEDRAGNSRGTGFLLPGHELPTACEDRWVLVTNAHVVSDDPEEQVGPPGRPRALPPEEAVVRFEAWDDPEQTWELGAVLFHSGRRELDCTILSLRDELPLEQSVRIPPGLPRLDGRQRIYLIGHPRGGQLAVSLHDSLLLDHEAPHIHYRSPTEAGSSGSPVFNGAWDLIGIHHAGGPEVRRLNGKPGTYPANEGISIRAVLEAMAQGG